MWLGIQDICSCAKEIAAGEDLNLAAVMARGTRGTIQQAIDDAYRWVCRRSEDYTGHRARVGAIGRRLGPDGATETDMTRYLQALDELLGGHLAWSSQDNPRYAQVIPSI